MLAADGFQLEEPFFHPQSAGSGKADQFSPGADNPMARDQDGDGISGQALAHRPGSSWCTGLPSQLAVGDGPAVRNLPTKGIDTGLKQADSARIDRHIGEIDDLSLGVGLEAMDQLQFPGGRAARVIPYIREIPHPNFPLLGRDDLV